MDPAAAWHTLTTGTDPTETRAAALDLLVWLAKGGGGPIGVNTRTIIDRCERELIAALDRLDELA